MQAGFVRYGEETRPVPRPPTRPLPEPWTDERAAACGIRPATGARRARRSRASTASATPHPVAAARGDPPRRLGAPGRALARPALEPRADPALRRRRGASSRRPPAAARTARSSTGSLQVGVAKEDQPHYLKIIARPEADVVRPRRTSGSASSRARTDEGRRPPPRPRRHRPGPDLRIADRPATRGGGLRFDRHRHAADEGNPRPRRRTGPRAGRRPLVEASVGSDERPPRIDRRPRRPPRVAAAGDRRRRPRAARPRRP